MQPHIELPSVGRDLIQLGKVFVQTTQTIESVDAALRSIKELEGRLNRIKQAMGKIERHPCGGDELIILG